eukprot:scaffold73644_cov45-Prasinocladus_malaysianus.AAC.1
MAQCGSLNKRSIACLSYFISLVTVVKWLSCQRGDKSQHSEQAPPPTSNQTAGYYGLFITRQWR